MDLEGLKREFEQYRGQQSQSLKALAETLRAIYDNQVELSGQATRADRQQAVLSRMTISNLNEILLRIGSEDLVTDEVIEQLFNEFDALKARKDYRKHMSSWFMGKDLSNLPPEPKEEPETETQAAEEAQEGPKEFGGDYAKSVDRNEAAGEEQPESEEAGQENAMSAGQENDRPSSQRTAVPIM